MFTTNFDRCGGGRVVGWSWVNFQCRGVLLIWIRVGQGPTALAVGAGGVVRTFLLSSIICTGVRDVVVPTVAYQS